jgi:hypothetical protein
MRPSTTGPACPVRATCCAVGGFSWQAMSSAPSHTAPSRYRSCSCSHCRRPIGGGRAGFGGFPMVCWRTREPPTRPAARRSCATWP